jgi:hypothetical protein
VPASKHERCNETGAIVAVLPNVEALGPVPPIEHR